MPDLHAENGMSLAKRHKIRRREAKMTQSQLARKSGVSLGSLKRFETTGHISLASLLRLAAILGYSDEFDNLFVRPYQKPPREGLRPPIPRIYGHRSS